MFKKVLIANRGEIAIRIARACADLDIASVAIHSQDDAGALHTLRADAAIALKGEGAGAYLDIAGVIAAAKASGAEAIHPGYGFLSENADFARACGAAGVVFIGPDAETIALLGDKARARALAQAEGLAVLRGSEGGVSAGDAKAFLRDLKRGRAMMIKAVAGGGGRGMAIARKAEEVEAAFGRCAAEAGAAFGNDALYVEEFLPRARHIEVQIAGDGQSVIHLHERDCSVQRRHQKLIEIAPSPFIGEETRARVLAAAVKLGQAAQYRALGTIEFLVDADAPENFYFMEANPRLQVEHTITEEALGLDLVRLQMELAAGRSLVSLSLLQRDAPQPRGYSIQARVNLERVNEDGAPLPSGGAISLYEPPTGPGVRVDGAGHAGLHPNPRFDTLMAKVICTAPHFAAAAAKCARALKEFRVEGADTNIPVLRALLASEDFLSGAMTTRFYDENFSSLLDSVRGFGGAQAKVRQSPAAAEGLLAITAPLRGTICAIHAEVGQTVRKGDEVALIEAMKMQHAIVAQESGVVLSVEAALGETLDEDAPFLFIEAQAGEAVVEAAAAERDLDEWRADLREAMAARAKTLDDTRPSAVARRRKTGHRTARENIADLVDPDSFIEYGALTIAAQRRRRSLEDLVDNTPADGLVAGIGAINGAHFPEEDARAIVMAYDYTVLAGTQGFHNHKKTDRMLELAEHWRLPIVFYTEGGGGRPGDTDWPSPAGLDVPTFAAYGRLSGLQPRIGVTAGRCFAGNAAFYGSSDITIATRDANIGMGGPAMIEGGGLGAFAPEDVGPTNIQFANGVIDILTENEAEATLAAKKTLSFFQGAVGQWRAADQRQLRHAVPENRLRAYDVRNVIKLLFDEGELVELRGGYGAGIYTYLARVEGRPVGVIANNPRHLGGAIDAEGAEKAARFVQLCDGFDVPIVSLIDTPGFMVGPEHEKRAGVRRMSSLMVTGATISVPLFAVVLRKSYGLGAQAMAGGSLHRPFFTTAWPTGEFGGMGLEGAVRLGFRKELEALADLEARDALFQKLVAEMYERGKAIAIARALEIDAVIDPAETRAWLVRGLKSAPPKPRRDGKKRQMIDVW